MVIAFAAVLQHTSPHRKECCPANSATESCPTGKPMPESLFDGFYPLVSVVRKTLVTNSKTALLGCLRASV
jgi:hypothetical protein